METSVESMKRSRSGGVTDLKAKNPPEHSSGNPAGHAIPDPLGDASAAYGLNIAQEPREPIEKATE